MDTIQKFVLSLAMLAGLSQTQLAIEMPRNLQKGSEQVLHNWSEIGIYKYTPTHKQEVWIYVLEWCESRGDNNAVNPKDLDNTPSYGSYQFKPGTLQGYAVKYGLLPADLEVEDYINWSFDSDLTHEILIRMVGDKDVSDKMWRDKEFPGCVKKHGLPPR